MHFPLPMISISPPPPEETIVEPCSPFSSHYTPAENPEDSFRPIHLTPPLDMTTFLRKPLSPLRPLETVDKTSGGLERERFETLLRASRERNSLLGTRKSVDLRKEITIKVLKTKQEERRARFLSKILVNGSRSHTLATKILPEPHEEIQSSLPSPLPVLPSTHAGFLGEKINRPPRIENNDSRHFENLNVKQSEPGAGRLLPSLDQISARLTTPTSPNSRHRPSILPDYQSVTLSDSFVRHHETIFKDNGFQSEVMEMDQSKNRLDYMSNSTTSALISPTTSSHPPASRERRAFDMLSAIGRRTGHGTNDHHRSGRDNRKRHSAPADLTPLQQRSGFEHPVLARPGGF